MLDLHAQRVTVAMPKDALVMVIECAYLFLRSRNDVANGAQIQEWLGEMRKQLGERGRISIKSLS